MLIDCATCVVRDINCDDCVISVLLATPPPRQAAPPRRTPAPAEFVELDETARYALENLAEAGLVPPLRLVAALPETGGRKSRTGREIA